MLEVTCPEAYVLKLSSFTPLRLCRRRERTSSACSRDRGRECEGRGNSPHRNIGAGEGRMNTLLVGSRVFVFLLMIRRAQKEEKWPPRRKKKKGDEPPCFFFCMREIVRKIDYRTLFLLSFFPALFALSFCRKKKKKLSLNPSGV